MRKLMVTNSDFANKSTGKTTNQWESDNNTRLELHVEPKEQSANPLFTRPNCATILGMDVDRGNTEQVKLLTLRLDPSAIS